MIDARAEMMHLSEKEYAKFSKGLIPGSSDILGVRLPALRDLAKRIAREDWRAYLDSWEGEYFEDFMLRAFVIAYVRIPVDERLALYRDFIPLIDNWSVCDSFCATWKPRRSEREAVWEFILPYLDSGEEFQIRFCLSMFNFVFVDEEHIDMILEKIDAVRHGGYYVMMGAAWTLSTCFIKFPERTMAYLRNNSLDDATYNKTLQKIVESYRVSDDMKNVIRGMKRVSGSR